MINWKIPFDPVVKSHYVYTQLWNLFDLFPLLQRASSAYLILKAKSVYGSSSGSNSNRSSCIHWLILFLTCVLLSILLAVLDNCLDNCNCDKLSLNGFPVTLVLISICPAQFSEVPMEETVGTTTATIFRPSVVMEDLAEKQFLIANFVAVMERKAGLIW